jgi:hypothetical protein
VALQSVSRGSVLRSQVEISPGSIRLRRTVPPDDADDESGEDEPGEPKAAIRVWTAKSRRQMTRSYASLDLAPMYASNRLPVAITLTYPASWLVVAPDGEAVQRHFAVFRRRWERAWGVPMMGLWKREFQRRGAPHIHAYAGQPAGVAGDGRRARYQADVAAWVAGGCVGWRPRWRPAAGDGLRLTQWVALVWADVVSHPDSDQRVAMIRAGTQVSFKEALRYSDPKRLSIYFAKHGLYRDKEYQNQPPEEWDDKPVGRFWGYFGLVPLIVAAQVDGGQDYYLIKRTLRRWSSRTRVWDERASCYRYVKAVRVRTRGTRKVRRRGVPTDVPRLVRRPVSRLGGYSGSICVNDAPSLARDLVRVVAQSVAADEARLAWRRKPGLPVMGESFYCECCKSHHPLREHRVCRDRARLVVSVR